MEEEVRGGDILDLLNTFASTPSCLEFSIFITLVEMRRRRKKRNMKTYTHLRPRSVQLEQEGGVPAAIAAS